MVNFFTWLKFLFKKLTFNTLRFYLRSNSKLIINIIGNYWGKFKAIFKEDVNL